ncbi:MAG: RecQ family ATP-dependent DNA helicase, partial [Eubacteriales bacterium]|nr:RecQ family ATP-dependent DNA helicase [Eubacteriales bacterium]
MGNSIVFIDSEIGIDDKKICDLGAVRSDQNTFHGVSVNDFCSFTAMSEYLCGHNIIDHDMKYLKPHINIGISHKYIDTLYLSPLLFPKRPYHALLKDDKLQSEELNNPLNDAIKAQKLFYDEMNAFHALSSQRKNIYLCLLYNSEKFQGFFDFIELTPYNYNAEKLIAAEFKGKICAAADILLLIRRCPVELAYALALIGSDDYHSVTPRWLQKRFPYIENVIKFLCNTPCGAGCGYCSDKLNIHKELKTIFGYDSFRTYNGEPLQERAARAAVDGKSLLAVFPTGGGKSVTFQLPALMAGKAVHGLTVIISPLQALMKDQVDNLNEKGIVDAVTVNGLLSPIERSNAYECVYNGTATLLYISPEQLRSKTIESMLMSRNIVRFVIDEAHCFSAWGHDFRVDYLYIGDFIYKLQQKKKDKKPIPVSCFTATAKQKVISDICDYFKRKLDIELELFASSAARENLKYVVLYKETEEDKYQSLRLLLEQKNCPTIIYVSRTKRTHDLAQRLTGDGFPARPFNGKMNSGEKIANQEAFINNEVMVMVATSAFGMGVDKKDVRLVIHYDISDSLENYIQESGRAGRDPAHNAECYVLYGDSDLDKHFILLNQSKLSLSEIQQVWKAIKDFTKLRPYVCCSPLEIARQAGWDESVNEVEMRVKNAVAALENAGYIERGYNIPHIYATSILAKNMQEAVFHIDRSTLFSESQKLDAKRIIKSLISSRSIAKAGNDDAESRVDYL